MKIEKILLVGIAAVTAATLAACAVFAEIAPVTDQVMLTTTQYKVQKPKQSVPPAEMITVNTTELDCLHKNIYWEARNQSLEGMIAVATVTLNRASADGYPSSICEVVYQAERDDAGNIVLNRCQFSWYCDGLGDEPNLADEGERKAWRKSRDVAEGVLLGKYKSDTMVKDALYYHADYVQPAWAATKVMVAKISSHIFYKEKADKGAGAKASGV